MMTAWFPVILWKWPIIKNKSEFIDLNIFDGFQLLSSLKFTLSHFCPVVVSSSWFLCHFYMNSVWLFTTVEILLCMYYTYYLLPFFWLQYIYIVRVQGHMCIYYTIFFNIFIYFMFIPSFNLHLVLFLQLNMYVSLVFHYPVKNLFLRSNVFAIAIADYVALLSSCMET